MDCELPLTKTNRLLLARAFHDHKRVDYSIDCVIEGQMGKAFVDDPAHPRCFRITVGPFWTFAGEAKSPGGYRMMQGFPAYHLFMPSPHQWLELACEIHGQNMQPLTRYRFSAAELTTHHLLNCLESTGHQARIVPIDHEMAAQLTALPDSYLELSEFDSIGDFLERGLGYTMLDGNRFMGAAYSSLVCSKGVEVSIYVEDQYRRTGIATALASRLLLECLEQGRRPNWDAANPESYKLARKLGYTFVEAYDAYYHTSDPAP